MKPAARVVGTRNEEASNPPCDKAAEIIWKHNLRKQSPIDIRSTVGKHAYLVAFAGSCHAAGCKPAVQPGEGRPAKRLEAASTLPEGAGLRRLPSSCRKRQSCTPRARHISAQGKRPKARRFQESPASANQSPGPMCHSPRSRASRLSKPWDHAL